MRYPLVHKNVKGFMHGGDYNPDQWLHMPEVIEEDYRLMKLANTNTFSLNIFGWSAIERTEGEFTFGWLDDIMDRLAEENCHVILATPSGARPAWLSQTYPEVLRVEANRVRNLHGLRHNHCFTSPVYREKVRIMNEKLAERYASHPALIMWHLSNEYGGECHCDLCQDAFRTWLKKKYKNDLEMLNQAWWTGFWSHTYSDWSQIESPAPHGENMVHGMNLDWRRFVNDQTIDFYKQEIVPLREVDPSIPVTTNFMGNYPHMRPFLGLDYEKFAKELDVVTWDSYPAWHYDKQSTTHLASDVGFVHDVFRSLKDGQPFLIMENTPSLVNWHDTNKAKEEGVHALSAIQAVAHGADSILYFQWRKGRGASEKFHGAVVDHSGSEKARVFQEVAELGDQLNKIEPIAGTSVAPEVAIIFDWENHWAIDDAQALSNVNKKYSEQCQAHYHSFWKQGVPVDVIGMEKDFSKYKILVGPMLYMVKPGVAERIEAFVEAGGTFVATYWSGVVDENDLCFLGGFPGPLKNLLGVWAEEIDSLYPDHDVVLSSAGKTYKVTEYCERVHVEGAEVLARFETGGYKERPAVTVNKAGAGKAYYIASSNEQSFYDDFYQGQVEELGLTRVLQTTIPEGVSVQMRTDGETDYVFVMNFSEETKQLDLSDGSSYTNVLTDETQTGAVTLDPYKYLILSR
ncbi:beta-galactosidase [Alkalicoccobacillus murimartini]|uniref:Beta-galactosidase n=1 Tax=Alkalicoccobacillus murimartini TaxID=171685 RepID=A0ABT9YH29_9BACI|nr:beta-galactosidase [Alkalicoccobacillus murimartini]MDQ0206908.1 beta-galactosidase [Alkalicoccobacillus murimartini]